MENEKQGFFTRLFGPVGETRSAGNPNGDGMLPGIIPPSALVEQVTPSINEALSVSAVFASVNTLTNWISQLDLAVYRNGEQIPAPTFITSPKIDENGAVVLSTYDLLKQTVTSMALTGEAFWLVGRSKADGKPYELEVLNPFDVVIEVKDGKTEYRYGLKVYNSKRVVHIKGMSVPGRLHGLGPIEANAGLRGVLNMRKHSEQWFGPNAKRNFYLKTSQNADVEELNEATARVESKLATGHLVGMDKDFDLVPLIATSADTQYLEQMTFAITEIARWFGIPPYLVLASVDGNSMTYSNLQTDARLFVTNTLMGYMQPIQEALTGLLVRGQVAKFSTDALLKADAQTRYEAYATAISAGFMTEDEARALEGWQPLPEKPVAAEPNMNKETLDKD